MPIRTFHPQAPAPDAAPDATSGTAPGVVPVRVDATDVARARALLDRDGAVLLTGLDPTADALVVGAALVLGDRLRRLFPVRRRASRDADPVHLHADSFDVTVDIGGVLTRRRDPDEDHVLVQCVQAPDAGGASFVADAYRFVDERAAADPELWTFLTTADVDLYGAWAGLRGLPTTPRVGRHVEYTRGGRRIVRRTDGVVPLHRDPDSDHIRAMLARLDEEVRAVERNLPRFSVTPGEILLLDNYRCWHGRDGHSGDRAVRILTLRSSDAR